MCGVCECDQDFFGRHCECSSSAGADVDDNKSCRHDNITTLECSGRGNCVCGQCECHTRDNKDEVTLILERKLRAYMCGGWMCTV